MVGRWKGRWIEEWSDEFSPIPRQYASKRTLELIRRAQETHIQVLRYRDLSYGLITESYAKGRAKLLFRGSLDECFDALTEIEKLKRWGMNP